MGVGAYLVLVVAIVSMGLIFTPFPSADAIEIQVPATLSEATFTDWMIFPDSTTDTKIDFLTDGLDGLDENGMQDLYEDRTGIFSQFNNERNTFHADPNLSGTVSITNVRIEGTMAKGGDFPGATKVRFIVVDDVSGVESAGPDNFLKKDVQVFTRDMPVHPIRGDAWQLSDFTNTVSFGVEQATDNKRSAVYELAVIITIIDEPPVITIGGANPLNLLSSSSYDDSDVTAFDVPDGDLTIPMTHRIFDMDGNEVFTIDTGSVGFYTFEYSVTDSRGNIGTATRTVNFVNVLLDNPIKYIIGDGGIVTVIDFLAYQDPNVEDVSATVTSLSPLTGIRDTEIIQLTRAGEEGFFQNISPVNFVPDGTIIDPPLLVVAVDDDVFATYLGFDSGKTIIADPSTSGFNAAPPRTFEICRFAESEVYEQTDSATVKVNDILRAGQGTVQVKITSESNTAGFDITLYEDPPAPFGPNPTGKFTSNPSVTFGASSFPSSQIIGVAAGQQVFVKYPPTSPTCIASARIVLDDDIAYEEGYQVDTNRRDTCTTDLDGDIICDAWETPTGLRIPTGMTDGSGNVIYYTLPCGTGTADPVCPTTTRKDYYLEWDCMTGHCQFDSAMDAVKTALGNPAVTPVRGLSGATPNGIAFHPLHGEEIPHQTLLPYTAGVGVTSFQTLKKEFFGTVADRTAPSTLPPGVASADDYVEEILTAKRQVVRYALIGHQQEGNDQSSGTAEKPGNDMFITLGAFTGHTGTEGQKIPTVMHEVGHTLGLGHGGGDEINCKGNYLSIMNYPFQFTIPEGGFVLNRLLAFSTYKFSNINENALREDVNSITSQSGKNTIIGGWNEAPNPDVPFQPLPEISNTPVDWNRNGPTSGSYVQNTRFFAELPDCQDTSKINFAGYNDISNLVWNFRLQSSMDSGVVQINQIHLTTSTEGAIDPNSLAPGLDAISDASGNEGEDEFSGEGTYKDPDADTITGTIDWDDGTTEQLAITMIPELGAQFSYGPHIYADDRLYQVTVTVTSERIDDGNNSFVYSSTDTAIITVNNVAPVVDAGDPLTVTGGVSFTFSDVSFSDAGVNDADWIATIVWNDGTSTPLTLSSQGLIPGTHTYNLPQFLPDQTFIVPISVRDKDDGTGTASKTIIASRLLVSGDLDPSSSLNGLKLNDKGTTQYAIFSSDAFDATKIVTTTVKLKANTGVFTTCAGGAPVERFDTRDVNGDGRVDMIMHFKTSKLCLTANTTQVIISGSTQSGTQFYDTEPAKVTK